MRRRTLIEALQAATAADLEDVRARIAVLRSELKSLRRVEEILGARFGKEAAEAPGEALARPRGPGRPPKQGPRPGDVLLDKPRVVRSRLAEPPDPAPPPPPADEKQALETDREALQKAGTPAAEPREPGVASRLYQQRLAAARYLKGIGQARPVMIGNNCSIPPGDLAQVFRCDWFVNVGDYIGLTAAGKEAVGQEIDQNCQPGRVVTGRNGRKSPNVPA